MTLTRFLAIAGCVFLPAAAAAQETRAEEIAARQQAKAAALAPYQPTAFEKIAGRLEDSFVSPPNGFYPAFGRIYSGGGLTLGAGWRRFYSRNAVFDVRGLYSVKNYKQVEVGTRSPWHGGDRFAYGVKGGWLDAPEVGYYGLGMDHAAQRGNFRLSRTYAAFTAAARPNGWTRVIGEVGIDDYETQEGRGQASSIETIYDPSTAPGLGSSPAFVRVEGTAAIDWRTSPSYSTRGGYYGVTLTNHSNDSFGFNRLDGELIQHVPLLYNNWVISLRGRVQTVLNDDDVVPYFLLPQLGSSRTIRGYSSGRFRDRHSILTSAELRWIPNRLALDMAIFYDAGKVTRERRDLDFTDLESSWGIGARFHVPTSTILRIEAARPRSGKWRLVVATGAAF
jgi:hypothetical protein